ncbi:cell division control protein [Plectosphaerella plurivora]|uniref:Cell division control protein n=1 Tax=Plectosphaerella plurivora TaxID=936078 RepID=A0A9P8VAK9_9PEZI|nr:cell division control protein [Plectosphaerella plurivora]
MTPSPGPQHTTTMDARPRSSQTVSVTYDDSSPAQGRDLSRLRVELSECIETKTVTTTTTTKRTFPPLTMREARPLSSLDGKEYPLANTPLPPELVSFSYTIPSGGETGLGHLSDEASHKRSGKEPLAGRHVAGLIRGNDSADNSIRQASASPSNSYPRNTRKSGAWEDSPEGSPGPSGPKQQQQDRLAGHPLPLGERPALRLFKRMNRSTREPSRGSRGGSFLATPDTPDLMLGSTSDRASRSRPSHVERLSRTPEHVSAMTSQPHDEGSPVGSDAHTVFSSNVATPPITDADAEPFADADESLQQAIRIAGTQALDNVAAQDASLPSPRLSPTLAAQQPQQDLDPADDATSLTDTFDEERGRAWFHESQTADELGEDSDANSFAAEDGQLVRLPTNMDPHATMLDVRSMVETFDSMPNEMKSFMMYNFLRRCSRKTLRLVADTVTPVLKCDFLKQMPPELQLNVLSYLDYRDLCRAAQVSKHWRHVVDSNETGWKELFDQDGYSLPPGELDRAIAQGWGWQDPVGPLSAEIDLSQMNRLTSADGEAAKVPVKPDPLAKLRSAKRKRGLNMGGADRTKRRASVHFEASRAEAAQSQIVKQHKSRGILTAASAAAAAVPDPDINLPSLRKMHLFKSLYRRHHMIQQGWTSGQVKPGHVAFAAHPRHVITCLQFDEDKIITGSDDTLIHVYDTKTGKLRKKLEGHEGGVWALQYEGNTLVSGSTDRSVRVWDIEKGFCTQVFYGHTSTVRCLQILMPTEIGRNHKGKAIMMPQKPLIITGSRDSQLRVWRLPEPGSRRYIQTGPPANDADCPYFIRTLTGHTHSVRAISAHGDTLVSGSYDSTVRVWRISTGESLHVLAGHSQKVYSVVYDHERNRCISGSMDSLVKIWDLNTGACLHTLEGHSLLVGLLDLRDQRLVSAAADSTLRIWDPDSGKCRNVLSAHTGAITCFQHDGRKVISGSEKTVKMWDIRTGECVQDLLTDLSGVWQVKFNERRCVAAVQRGALTYIEILDFGAVRDGMPPEELGQRRLLNEQEVHSLMAEDI